MEKFFFKNFFDKNFLSDTISIIIISTIGSMFIEIILSDMSLQQSINIRLISIPPTILTSGIYGKYRDYIIQHITKRKNVILYIISNAISYITFQIPIYVFSLEIMDANNHQIFVACASSLLFSFFAGIMYGIAIDYGRYITAKMAQKGRYVKVFIKNLGLPPYLRPGSPSFL